jgi:hypothetical protein
MFLKSILSFQPEEQERILVEIRKAEDRWARSGSPGLLFREIPWEGQRNQRLGMTRTKARNESSFTWPPKTENSPSHRTRNPGQFGVTEEVKEKMQKQFRNGRICEGICQGIREIGEKLKAYFPVEKDDRNELPDTISEEK